MNVGDFLHSAEINRKVISDMIEVVVEGLTFELILAFWLKQIVCPGSYIRSPVICICQEVGLPTSIYLFGERIVSSVRVVTSAHWVTEQASASISVRPVGVISVVLGI